MMWPPDGEQEVKVIDKKRLTGGIPRWRHDTAYLNKRLFY